MTGRFQGCVSEPLWDEAERTLGKHSIYRFLFEAAKGLDHDRRICSAIHPVSPWA